MLSVFKVMVDEICYLGVTVYCLLFWHLVSIVTLNKQDYRALLSFVLRTHVVGYSDPVWIVMHVHKGKPKIMAEVLRQQIQGLHRK